MNCWKCAKEIRFWHKSKWITPYGNPNMDAYFHPKCMRIELAETEQEEMTW